MSSQQGLDLRRSIQIVWRHKILVGAVAVLGILVARCVWLSPPADADEHRAGRSPAALAKRTGGSEPEAVRLTPIPLLKSLLRAAIRCFRLRFLISGRLRHSPSFAAKFRSAA